MADIEYVRRAIAAENRVAELEREIERLKRENRLLREGQAYWQWKAWAEKIGLRRLDMEDEPGVSEPR